MDWIRDYALQITAAAIVCGLLRLIVGKKGAVAGMVNMLTAVFMLLTLLRPIGSISFLQIPNMIAGVEKEAESLVASGEEYRLQEMASIIKSRTEAYICDKAKDLGADLTAQVDLSAESVPVPVGVVLEGIISPYGKIKLSRILEDDLGIPMEAQTWMTKRS